MLIHSATLAEATPLIEALGLQKVYQKPYLLYQGPSHKLVISGIGALHSASALGWALATDPQDVLNIGYAAGQKVGTLYNIHKVIDRCSDKVYHLTPSSALPNATCETYPRPLHTPIKNLADMEASAVVVTTRRFGRRCHILKVVSDRFDPDLAPKDDRLIRLHISEILSLL
ncbi:MAG: hypothetical protein C6H99_03150 [Epsilonproteobacteria bacterium]|nr:hypothetical protein [Campylobacterota bacterium]NPA63458.1 hypothetical protein [Campylobacterota bacterium]